MAVYIKEEMQNATASDKETSFCSWWLEQLIFSLELIQRNTCSMSVKCSNSS